MPGPTADMRKRKTALRKRTTLFWLGRPDLNRRMEESKSSALPLGDGPVKEKTVRDWAYTVFGGVPREIRTLGLQSHNLAR